MFKNRVLLGLRIISLVLVSLAISSSRIKTSLSNRDAASDFAERHPNQIARRLGREVARSIWEKG